MEQNLELPILKTALDDFEVEFNILTCHKDISHSNPRKAKIASEIEEINLRIGEVDRKVNELNSEIDKLTNHADGIDYMVAVGSGMITGIIDIVFVGEFSIGKANEIGDKKEASGIMVGP